MMSNDDVEHVFKMGDMEEIIKALRSDGKERFRAELLLKLEKLENQIVNNEEKWEGKSPHNKDVESGKRKGLRMAKAIVKGEKVALLD